MLFAVGALIIIIACLALYQLLFQRQLRSINRQLDKRLTEHTRQPVRIELFSGNLNRLAGQINQCLKAEENLRLNTIREEKRFKELIAGISHDLRTPLAAIKGYQQLVEKSDLSADQRRKIRIAQKHTDQLDHLLNQFFEYACLLNTELEPHRERINLTNFVTEQLAASIAVFEEKKIRVRLYARKPVFAFADQEMLTRILQNLIRNTAVHSDGDLTVRIFSEQSAVVSFRNPIKDPSEIDVGRLFDRFYTADRARGKSSGLGLSIVKMLAEQMDGRARAVLQGHLLEIRIELPAAGGAD